MALEKYFAVNTALARADSPVREIGRHGIFTIESRGFPKLGGGLTGRMETNIYTVPTTDLTPEAATLNEVLGKLIDQISIPIKADEIQAFTGGITAIGPRITYSDMQLGRLKLYEEVREEVTLAPRIDEARNAREINELLVEFSQARIRLQSGLLIHIIPSIELARIGLLLAQGDESVASLQGRRDWAKLSNYDVQRLADGKPIYPHLQLPEQTGQPSQ